MIRSLKQFKIDVKISAIDIIPSCSVSAQFVGRTESWVLQIYIKRRFSWELTEILSKTEAMKEKHNSAISMSSNS